MILSFEEWEKRVDIEINVLSGMGIDFLPDWNSFDAFMSGMSPTDAAAEWLAEAETY